MKALGEARIEAISRAVAAALEATPELSVLDQGRMVAATAAHLRAAFAIDPELDRSVRRRIESLSRTVPEGSREWDLLYSQYLEEARRRA